MRKNTWRFPLIELMVLPVGLFGAFLFSLIGITALAALSWDVAAIAFLSILLIPLLSWLPRRGYVAALAVGLVVGVGGVVYMGVHPDALSEGGTAVRAGIAGLSLAFSAAGTLFTYPRKQSEKP
ncbi:hypothetical protein [Corynebacterium lowii]|nr:hypothetical protein [Corynebacterium lowii]MDP9852305.1 hypothetical protein [Corynebacterium lowii]